MQLRRPNDFQLNFIVTYGELFYLFSLVLTSLLNKSLIFKLAFKGFENHDSGVGIYAPDADAYTVFAPIFDPIIEDYHKGFTATDKHPQKDWGDVNTLGDLDPEVKYNF